MRLARGSVSSSHEMASGRPAGEEGQGLVEYALILMFVAIALVGTLGVLQGGLTVAYATVTGAIPSV